MLTARDAAEIAGCFCLGADPVMVGPVARGEVGQIWKLMTDRGSFAVKETFWDAPDPAETEAAATLQETMERAGIPVPRVIRTPAGAVLADVGNDPAPTVVRVYSWVDLLPRDRLADPAAVGALVASIHRHLPTAPDSDWPVDEWFVSPIGATRWRELVAASLQSGAPFAERLADCAEAIIDAERVLRQPGEVHLCHRDLFADNVLPTVAGGLCVIDWESTGPAERAQELGMVLYDFAGPDEERTRLLYRSYVEHGGPARIRDSSDFTMVIAALHHIGSRCIARWLDPAFVAEQQRSAAGALEFLEDPPARALVERMLDAIRPIGAAN